MAFPGPRLNSVRYEADCGYILVEGKRKRVVKWFREREKAEQFVDEQRRKKRQFGDSALAFSEEDRVRFTAAAERLRRLGATIEQAVDHYERTHKPLREVVSLGELLKRCLAAKGRSLAARSVKQLKSSCLSFVRGREDVQAGDVTKEDVVRWVLGNGWAPKTQRTYLGDLRSLFSWGVEQRYLQGNPIAGEDGFIELDREEEGEIPALDVEDCARLLWVAMTGRYRTLDRRAGEMHLVPAFRKLLGYLALTLFCGLRPEREAGEASVRDLDLPGRVFLVSAGSAKTRRRRPVELPRAAVSWLRLWRRWCPEQVRIVPANFTRLWRDLRRQAGLTDWPQDVLRHSAASYHYAAHQDLARLQAWLGHSEDEDTLFRHYRAVRTLRGGMISRPVAEAFWGLSPRGVREWIRKRDGGKVSRVYADDR